MTISRAGVRRSSSFDPNFGVVHIMNVSIVSA